MFLISSFTLLFAQSEKLFSNFRSLIFFDYSHQRRNFLISNFVKSREQVRIHKEKP